MKRVLTMMSLVFLSACSSGQSTSPQLELEKSTYSSRFNITNHGDFVSIGRTRRILVIKDEKTDVEYLVLVDYEGMALTKMSNGTTEE